MAHALAGLHFSAPLTRFDLSHRHRIMPSHSASSPAGSDASACPSASVSDQGSDGSACSHATSVDIPAPGVTSVALRIRYPSSDDSGQPSHPWRNARIISRNDYLSQNQHRFPPLFNPKKKLPSAWTKRYETPYDDEDHSRFRFTLETYTWSLVISHRDFKVLEPKLEGLSICERRDKIKAFFEESLAGELRTMNGESVPRTRGNSEFLPMLQVVLSHAADNDEYHQIWRRGKVPARFTEYKLHSEERTDGSASWQVEHPGFDHPLTLLGEAELTACRGSLPSLNDKHMTALGAQDFEVPGDTEDHSNWRLQAEIAVTTLIAASNSHIMALAKSQFVNMDLVATAHSLASLSSSPGKPGLTEGWLESVGWKVPFPRLRTDETLHEYFLLHSRLLLDAMADTADYPWLQRKAQTSNQGADSEPRPQH